MKSLLDKIPQENPRGKAIVKMVFKSSQLGNIAGAQVIEGTIQRNYSARVVRNGEVLWKGKIASLKRGKDDVREVNKDMECGILLDHFPSPQKEDIIETYEITYLEQDL